MSYAVLFVPQQFDTIQMAIDACDGPATIVVMPGVYAESIRVAGKEYVVIQSARLSRRGVCLRGDDGSAAVLDVERSVLHLSGIEIRSNGKQRGCSVVDSAINMQECVVAGNRVGDAFGAGLFCRSSKVHLQKSAIVGNVIDARAPIAGGAGLYLEDSRVEIAGVTIQANEVHAQHRACGGGIWCRRSSMRMWRSRVTDNALEAAACDGGGICFEAAQPCQLGGSVITGNRATGGRGGGILVAGDPTAVAIHRNTVVRQNEPSDVELVAGTALR